jgi:hypothetical protein
MQEAYVALGRLLSEFFGFPLLISFHHGSPCSYITWGMNSRLIGGSSSEMFHPIDMNSNNYKWLIIFCPPIIDPSIYGEKIISNLK